MKWLGTWLQHVEGCANLMACIYKADGTSMFRAASEQDVKDAIGHNVLSTEDTVKMFIEFTKGEKNDRE